MPTYPPATPGLSGTTLTVDRYLNAPATVQRALNTVAQQRLISNFLFPKSFDATGVGSFLVEVSEGIYANDQFQTVAPLAEYPLTSTGVGTASMVTIRKTGNSTIIADETIARNRLDVVERDTLKMTNQAVFQFDALALSVASSAITRTQAAAATWGTAGADPFADLLNAQASVSGLNLGFTLDTVFLTPAKYAQLISSIRGILPREDGNAVFTGQVTQVAGMNFVQTTNMPSGVSVMAVDSGLLGGIAYETIGGDWTGGGADLQYKTERVAGRDGVRLFVRYTKVPYIAEPNAGIKITGA